MPRKNGPVNWRMLKVARRFIDFIEDDLDFIEDHVERLNKDYQEARKQLAEACEHTHRHSGLYLKCERRYRKNGDFPVASISWRIGHARHNRKNIQAFNSLGVWTSRISAGKRCSHYRQSDFRLAMPRAQKWERDLTWHYESYAKELREYCFHLLKVADDLVWFPTIPELEIVSNVNPYRQVDRPT